MLGSSLACQRGTLHPTQCLRHTWMAKPLRCMSAIVRCRLGSLAGPKLRHPSEERGARVTRGGVRRSGFPSSDLAPFVCSSSEPRTPHLPRPPPCHSLPAPAVLVDAIHELLPEALGGSQEDRHPLSEVAHPIRGRTERDGGIACTWSASFGEEGRSRASRRPRAQSAVCPVPAAPRQSAGVSQTHSPGCGRLYDPQDDARVPRHPAQQHVPPALGPLTTARHREGVGGPVRQTRGWTSRVQRGSECDCGCPCRRSAGAVQAQCRRTREHLRLCRAEGAGRGTIRALTTRPWQSPWQSLGAPPALRAAGCLLPHV